MTADERDRCLAVLRSMRPDHHWRQYGTRKGITKTPWHMEVSVRVGMSTFDDDLLTRGVIAAHRHHVRLEVGPGRGFGLMVIRVHPRQRTGSVMERHPGIERFPHELEAS